MRPGQLGQFPGQIWQLLIEIIYENLAEGVGFEPTRRFPAHTLSKRAPSATRPPLLSARRAKAAAQRRRTIAAGRPRATILAANSTALVPRRSGSTGGRPLPDSQPCAPGSAPDRASPYPQPTPAKYCPRSAVADAGARHLIRGGCAILEHVRRPAPSQRATAVRPVFPAVCGRGAGQARRRRAIVAGIRMLRLALDPRPGWALNRLWVFGKRGLLGSWGG